MIAMRPIREYDVIDLLNNGRFEGEVEGYVVMDGPKYLGHMLYRVDGAVTQVLECGVEEKMFVDGAVRACVAAGENAGATSFRVNGEDEKLAEWKNVFFPEAQGDVPNSSIFHTCRSRNEKTCHRLLIRRNFTVPKRLIHCRVRLAIWR